MFQMMLYGITVMLNVNVGKSFVTGTKLLNPYIFKEVKKNGKIYRSEN